MHTLVAFSASIANGVTYTGVAGVTDQSMTMDASNRYQAPGPWKVMATHAVIPNGTAGRINAPSLRTLVLPEIYPITVGSAPASLDGPLILGERGPSFVTAESFQPEISRGGAGAAQVYAALWIAPGLVPATRGPTFGLLASASITLVQGAWVLAPLTFSQTLPAGRYQVVGMSVICTNGVYARLVFPGMTQFRPGVMVQGTYGNLPWTQDMRMGGFGSYGEFVFNVPPQIEILGSAGGAQTATVILDVVKIG